MTEQHGIGAKSCGLRDDRGDRHRAEFGIEQADVVAVVDQRTADREQAERRQMIVGDPAADGGMGDIDQENAHERSLQLLA